MKQIVHSAHSIDTRKKRKSMLDMHGNLKKKGLIFGLIFGVMGTCFSVLIRMELARPGNKIIGGIHMALVLFSIFLVGLICISRFFFCRKQKKCPFLLIYIFLYLLILIYVRLLHWHLLSSLGLGALSFFIFFVGGLPLPAPSSPSSSSSWPEDSFGINVLLEPFSETEMDGASTSVNQREARPPLPANPVASRGEEAGPSNRAPSIVPYPYQPDEMIGGDCVLSIQRRLLAKDDCPSYEVIELARIQAEDLFEVKVEIIKVMAGLDPTGDWMGRGARALDNARTATGEPSLERLYALLDNLNGGGVQSHAFADLKSRMISEREGGGDENSST